jgi:hypothetical protein
MSGLASMPLRPRSRHVARKRLRRNVTLSVDVNLAMTDLPLLDFGSEALARHAAAVVDFPEPEMNPV